MYSCRRSRCIIAGSCSRPSESAPTGATNTNEWRERRPRAGRNRVTAPESTQGRRGPSHSREDSLLVQHALCIDILSFEVRARVVRGLSSCLRLRNWSVARMSVLFVVWAVSATVAGRSNGDEHLGSTGGTSGSTTAVFDGSNVLAFYYLWYGNPQTDGRYMHWNHSVLPHWTPAVNARYPNIGKSHEPPARIHAKFYPARGCYSVADPDTLQAQMTELRRSSVDTIVLSWWGRPGLSSGDTQGVVTDGRISSVLSAAASAGVSVAWHMEPYEGRTAESFRGDVRYLNDRYGQHPALLQRVLRSSLAEHTAGSDAIPQQSSHPRTSTGPVFFVYDSYHISAKDWAAVLGPPSDSSSSSSSIRGTHDDGTFIGLWLDESHGTDLAAGCFDGAYT